MQAIGQSASSSRTQNHRVTEEQNVYRHHPASTHMAYWRPFIALITQYRRPAQARPLEPWDAAGAPTSIPREFSLAELAAAINDLICDLSLCSWDCKCSYSIRGEGLGWAAPGFPSKQLPKAVISLYLSSIKRQLKVNRGE